MALLNQPKQIALTLVAIALVDAADIAALYPNAAIGVCLLGITWAIRKRVYLPALVVAVVLASVLPVEMVTVPADQWPGPLFAGLAGAAGSGLIFWTATQENQRRALPGIFAIVAVCFIGIWAAPELTINADSLTMDQLERELVRGRDVAISPWVHKAMANNVGPKRFKQICSMRDWAWDETNDRNQYAKAVCESTLKGFPEDGAKLLEQLGDGPAFRLAADLYASAGHWGAAARATHSAIRNGGLKAALNLWRWKAIRGKVSHSLASWDAWNAEMNLETPAGAERSALRVTRAPGSLMPMHVKAGQRAVMVSTRYRDAFEVNLPGPPKDFAHGIKLKGGARKGFGLEILDNDSMWHRFSCDQEGPMQDSGFCHSGFGSAYIVLDESFPQPIRQIRMRGESILARVEVRAR